MGANNVLNVLRKWFPKHEFGELHDLQWNELTLLRHPDLVAIKAKEARENLKRLEAALTLAYGAMRNLPPDVLRAIEDTHLLNAKARLERAPRTATRDRLRGGDAEKEVFVSAHDLLIRLILGLSGEWPRLSSAPKTRGMKGASAYQAARAKIDGMTNANAQESTYETWNKVALVQNAHTIWRQFHEGQDGLTEGTDFDQFLGDLITALGKNWDVEAARKAWRRVRRKIASP